VALLAVSSTPMSRSVTVDFAAEWLFVSINNQ